MSGENAREEVLRFTCEQHTLWGILARPAAESRPASTAVLIVVGGPQYRAGSHRMFVQLARALAGAGFPALRFDYRGMGDSEGDLRDFTAAGPDLRAALDALVAAHPTTQRVVVWGLCDAASAAMMFATQDSRVGGIVAANPWARSDATLAAARVKHYYAVRLLQRDFWSKALSGEVRWRESLRSVMGTLRSILARRTPRADGATPFQVAMANGLRRFPGRVLLILSGDDLTAREFQGVAASNPTWQGLLRDARVTRIELAAADHTFSHRPWLDQMVAETIAWLSDLAREPCPMAAQIPSR